MSRTWIITEVKTASNSISFNFSARRLRVVTEIGQVTRCTKRLKDFK